MPSALAVKISTLLGSLLPRLLTFTVFMILSFLPVELQRDCTRTKSSTVSEESKNYFSLSA